MEKFGGVNKIEKKKEGKFKYIESLGKATILSLLILLGSSSLAQGQNESSKDKKEVEKELVKKSHAVGLAIYKNLMSKKGVSKGYDGISFKNTSTDETIYFKHGYGNNYIGSYFDTKDKKLGNIRYVDENSDGSIDKIILDKEKYESNLNGEARKAMNLFPLTFSDEDDLYQRIKRRQTFKFNLQDITVFTFEDIKEKEEIATCSVYDFNLSGYASDTNKNNYELWLILQKKYLDSLENFDK